MIQLKYILNFSLVTALKTTAIILGGIFLLTACAPSSRTTYDPEDVGRATETARGYIVTSRIVAISGETSNAGTIGGGVLGGASTGMVTESGWAALIGAVIGAGAGYLTEGAINARDGIEYVVELHDGRTIMVVQNRERDESPIASGAPVLVQLGGKYSRVLPDPRPHLPQRSKDRLDPDNLLPADHGLPPPPPPLEAPGQTDQTRVQPRSSTHAGRLLTASQESEASYADQRSMAMG